MKVTPEIYAWLASLNIIKPYESISKDFIQDFIIPEKILSSLFLGKHMDIIIQPLQNEHNKYYRKNVNYTSKLMNLKQLPESHGYISGTVLTSIKYENWKIIFEVLSHLGLKFSEGDIFLLANNNKDQLIEVITKIYQLYTKLTYGEDISTTNNNITKSKLSVLNLNDLELDKDYNECSTLLELIILSISKNMNLKPRQAIALLSNNRKYLKKICINGYIFDYQLLKNWLADLYDNSKLLIRLIKNSEDGLNIFFETIGTVLYSKDLDISLQAGELLNIVKGKIKMNWRWFYNEGVNAFIFILNKENLYYKKEFLKLFGDLILGQSSYFFDELKKKFYLGEKKLIYDFLSNIINEAVDMEKDFIENLQIFIYEICLSKTKDISYNLSILSNTFINFAPIEEENADKIISYFKYYIKSNKGNIYSTGISQIFYIMENFGIIKNKYAPQLYKIIVQLFLEAFDDKIKREMFLENFEKFFNANQDIPIDIFLEPYLNKLNNCQNYTLCDFLFLLKIVEHPRIEGKDISDIIQFILYVCLYNLNYARSANLILSLIFEKELITKNKNDEDSFKKYNISQIENQFVNFISKALDSYLENIYKKDDKSILETPYEIMTQNLNEVNLRVKNKIINSVKRYRRLKGRHSNGLLAMMWYYSDHDDIMMEIEEINRPVYEPMEKYLERKKLLKKEKDEKNYTKRVIVYLNKLTQKKLDIIMKKQELLEKNKIREEKIKNRLSEIRNITKLKLRPILLEKNTKLPRNNSQLYRNVASAQNNENIIPNKNSGNNINKLSRSHSELNIYEGNNEKDIIKQYKLLINYEQKNKYSDKKKVNKLIKNILIRKEDTCLYQELYNRNRKYYLDPDFFTKVIFLPFDLDEEEDRELQAIKGYNIEYKKNLSYYFKIYANDAREKISKMKLVKLFRDIGFDKERIEYNEINILIRLMFKYNLSEFDFNQFINILIQLAYIIFTRFRPCLSIGEAYGNILKRLVIKQINEEQVIALQKKYRDVMQYILQLRRQKEQFNMPEGFKVVKKTNVKYNFRLATHMVDYVGEAKFICYQILEEIIFDSCKSSLIEPYIDVSVIETVEIEPEKVHNWSAGLTMAYMDLDKNLQFYGMFAADALEDGIRKMIRKNYNEEDGDEMRLTKKIFNLKWAKKGIKEKKKLREKIKIAKENKENEIQNEKSKYKKLISDDDYKNVRREFEKLQKKIEDERIKNRELAEATEKAELEQLERKRIANKSINLECNKRMKIQLKNIREKRTGIRKEKEEEEKREANLLKRRDYIICEEDKKNNDFEKNINNSIIKMMQKESIKTCIEKYSNHLKVIYDTYSKMSLNKLNSKQVLYIDEFNQFLINFTIIGIYISLEQMNWIFKNISKASRNKRNNELYLDFEDFKLSIIYLTIFSNLENKSWKLKPKDIEEINDEKIEKFLGDLGLKLPFNKAELENFIRERKNMSSKNYLSLQQTKKRKEENSIYNRQLNMNRKEDFKVPNSIGSINNKSKVIKKTELIKNIKIKKEEIKVNINITQKKNNNKNIIKEEEEEKEDKAENKEEIVTQVQDEKDNNDNIINDKNNLNNDSNINNDKNENENNKEENNNIQSEIKNNNEQSDDNKIINNEEKTEIKNDKDKKDEDKNNNIIDKQKENEENIINNKNNDNKIEDKDKKENVDNLKKDEKNKEEDKNKKEEKKKKEEEEEEEDEEEEEEEDDDE